ncbi:MAG: ABC transporter permease [Chloroflexota bacterium]
MTTYIIRRILISIPVFLGITLIVFTLIALAPGDATTAFVRPEVAADPKALEAIRIRLGLDQPLPIRYVRWLAAAMTGELGYRIDTGVAIADDVLRTVKNTFMLMIPALLFGIFVGIPLGVLSAVRQYSKIDYVLTGIMFLGVSIPSFLLGLGGLYVFGLRMKLIPVGGMTTVGQDFDVVDYLRHLALPALILGFGYAAILLRYTRASMLEVINQDFINTARAKGLSGRIVVGRHAFRNALIPIITIIALALPEMIGGAVVTEQVFSWPGVGQALVDGVTNRDFYLIMGITMVLAVAVLLANLAADILYGFADPRIRRS